MKHIVSFSGGKESTSLVVRMLELKMVIDEIIFCDNGLEYPEVYAHIKRVEEYIQRPVTVVKPRRDWDELFYTRVTKGSREGEIRGFPFVIVQCWAQRDLKVRPMQRFQSKEDMIYLGINYTERDRVQTEKGKCENLRYPLIDWKWTAKDCINYLKKIDLLPPLYKKFKRTGCWLCPKQSMDSLRILFRDYPDLWERLKKYESDSPHGFKPGIKLINLETKWKSQVEIAFQDSNI
jgi:3'-phosphoadenosine 5'-phosphosulfate sulfotransferase (PAPS reductase)/FAD synthetase